MDGNWISSLRTAPAASATPGGYDDISLLLAHTQLDGFAYQSFRNERPRSVAAAAVSAAPAPAPVPAPAQSASLPQATIACEAAAHPLAAKAAAAPVSPTPEARVSPKAVIATASRAASGAAFGALVDRLIAGSAQTVPERPVLELHLPSRPLASREAAAHEHLIALPTQRAFARLRDAAPQRLALAR